MSQREEMIERVSDLLLSLDSTAFRNLIDGFQLGLVTTEEVMEEIECRPTVAQFNHQVLVRMTSKLQAA